jgi:hypothetical protein
LADDRQPSYGIFGPLAFTPPENEKHSQKPVGKMIHGIEDASGPNSATTIAKANVILSLWGMRSSYPK